MLIWPQKKHGKTGVNNNDVGKIVPSHILLIIETCLMYPSIISHASIQGVYNYLFTLI